jgi:hypothetical protein
MWEMRVEQIRQGLADYRATGAELFRPYYLALLAEAYGKAERERGRPYEMLSGDCVAAENK